jgi:dCTP deaminase
MPLADWQIENLCLAGMVEPFDPDLINPASIDVRLGDNLMIESAATSDLVPYPLSRHSQDNPYPMVPGQFALAQTDVTLDIPPSLAAEFKLKSSRAREGLQHLLAGWIDPGFNGSVLTLELKNVRQLHAVPLWPGLLIGQLVFQRMDALPRRSYAKTGRYNGDTTVQPSRG